MQKHYAAATPANQPLLVQVIDAGAEILHKLLMGNRNTESIMFCFFLALIY